MSSSSQVFLGIDIGGTKLAVNGIGPDRKPLARDWIEVPARSTEGPMATVGQIVVGLKAFLDREKIETSRVAGVGLDSPGPADIDGKIERSANMHPAWEGFQLREHAEKAVSEAFAHKIPVSYENDANAAALWESHVGDPEAKSVTALVAPGTGLGGGIVIQGRLVRGARGMGGELGHIEIVHPPFAPGWEPQCGCGQKYCAEAYASMAALMKILPVALAQPQWKDHPLNKIEAAPGEDLYRKRAYQVRTLAAKGDPLCQAIFDWQAEAIAKLCRQIADTVDPTRIVIGGGFIEGGEQLTARVMGIIREKFKPLAFKKHAAEIQITTATAGDQAGCLGAALSAWQKAHGA